MKITNPSETFQVCCYRSPDGTLFPNFATIAHTSKECADKTREVLGLSRYKRKKGNFVIMPFHLNFVPAWIEVDETPNNVVKLRP